MAELPRYQQTGRNYSDAPAFDFANLRESARASQSLSQGLDRLSTFAYKAAGDYAEKKAEQDAVSNPITFEQLQIAQQSGIDPEDLVKAAGGGTIYQETLRKFQGEQLRSQLEVHGQAALVDIQKQIELGQLTNLNDIQQKMESAIGGYTAPLARINPESAVRYQSSMATTAKTFYQQATKKLTDDYKNDQQILSQANLVNSLDAAKASIRTITDPAMLNETKTLLYRRVYEQAREGGTEFAQVQADKFLKEFDALKLNRFTEVATSKDFAPDMLTAVQKIRSGNFGDATPLYASLSEEEKIKVRQNAVGAWNDEYNAMKDEEKILKIQNKEKDDADIIRMYELPDNSKEKRQIARDLFKRDVISQDTLKGIINPKDDGEGNAVVSANAETDIIYGYITNEKQLRKMYPNLTNKQFKNLSVSLANKVVANSKAQIRIAAGASENPFAPIPENVSVRIQSINKFYDKFAQETNPDGTRKYTPDEATSLAINEYPKSVKFGDAKKAQKNNLDAIHKEYADFNPDKMTPEAYGKTYKLSKDKVDRISKKYKDYLKQKDITGLNGDAL